MAGKELGLARPVTAVHDNGKVTSGAFARGHFASTMAKRAGRVGLGICSAYAEPFTATGGCVAIDTGLPGSRLPI